MVQTGAVNFEKMSDEISLTSNYLTIAMRKRRRRTIIKSLLQLVFRAKLTQHTAFERTDNTEPAAVTALAISK